MFMRASRNPALAALALALIVAGPAETRAEPQEPTAEELDDTSFAKSFVGKNYDGELDIEGWTDLGGGLVIPPIYVRQYQRDDGTFLVLTSREVAKASRNTPANYAVVDALVVAPPPSGTEFTISCVQGKDETLRFMGVAKGPDEKEWWTDVRRAWEILIDTGEIKSVKAKGVRCTNVSWGQ